MIAHHLIRLGTDHHLREELLNQSGAVPPLCVEANCIASTLYWTLRLRPDINCSTQ